MDATHLLRKLAAHWLRDKCGPLEREKANLPHTWRQTGCRASPSSSRPSPLRSSSESSISTISIERSRVPIVEPRGSRSLFFELFRRCFCFELVRRRLTLPDRVAASVSVMYIIIGDLRILRKRQRRDSTGARAQARRSAGDGASLLRNGDRETHIIWSGFRTIKTRSTSQPNFGGRLSARCR